MSFHSESESDGGGGEGEAGRGAGQGAGPGHCWRTVRVSLYCPARGFNQLVTITDPASRWILAETVPPGCDLLPTFTANFMFKTFCTFG